jgi:hypothetical protein
VKRFWIRLNSPLEPHINQVLSNQQGTAESCILAAS